MESEWKQEYSLEARVAALLKQRGYKAATAESCTGGLLAGRLVNVPGVSQIFQEGYITYSNDAKEKLLHVPHQTLETYGAVSSQTAQAMADGAAAAAGVEVALATTGIAGPDGGTPQKPAGLVYVSCHIKGVTVIEEHYFAGERAQVRSMAVEAALLLAEQALCNVSFTEG